MPAQGLDVWFNQRYQTKLFAADWLPNLIFINYKKALLKVYMDYKEEILRFSYWEHFKAAKELALIFPPDHPKIIGLNKSINEILEKITLLGID